MASPVLNQVSTQNTYQEAVTAVFSTPRPGFAVIVNNAAVYYQLALPGGTNRDADLVWESVEHQLVPSLASFTDPAQEGYPGITLFCGIRLRSFIAGTPAVISVN